LDGKEGREVEICKGEAGIIEKEVIKSFFLIFF